MLSLIKYSPKNILTLSFENNLIGTAGIKLLIKADLPILEKLHIRNCNLIQDVVK